VLPERARALLAASRRTAGFLPEDEADALFAVARRAALSRLGPLLEVGAYCGRSTLVLAAALAAADASPPLVCFSIDHHRGSEEMQAGWEAHDPSLVDPATGRMDSLPAWRRAVTEAGAEDLVVGVVGESSLVAANWSTPLSLAFIDGGHGSEPAWADYRGWAPHVAPGGFLAFHDVFEDPAAGGRPPYECFEHARASGAFVEVPALSRASLRVLQRVAPEGRR
jgi:predicted O-methyltransferase YrrM